MRKTTTYARNRARQTPRRDGITVARMHNTRLTPREIERILGPCRRAVEAFRTGRGIYDQWVVLCTAGHVAEAMEDGGVIRGQREIIDTANTVLDSIGARAGRSASAWRAITLHGHEITALSHLVAAHSRQVHELTYGEYKRAADLAEARVSSSGGKVFRMEASVPA
jgi:hypothetical protein